MKYYVKDHQEPEDACEYDTGDELVDELAAIECAADFERDGGWEYEWPLTFVLTNNKGDSKAFKIEREFSPEFYAEEVDE